MTIWNARRVALGIFSGTIIFIFVFGAASTLVRAKPFHLLSQTARLLESPTGAFIAAQPRSFRSYFFTGKVVTGNGMLLLSAYRRRAADSAQAYPHGLSHKRLKIGGTQKILSLCTGSRFFPIIVARPPKVNRPPCPAAAPPPAAPPARGCRTRSAHRSRFAPHRCRAGLSGPAP